MTEATTNLTRAGEQDGRKTNASAQAIRRVLTYPEARYFLGDDGVEYWLQYIDVIDSRENAGADQPVAEFVKDDLPANLAYADELQLIVVLAGRPEHWWWAALAVMNRLDPLRKRSGQRRVNAGWKEFKRLCSSSLKVTPTLGRTVGHVHNDLQSGISPRDVQIPVAFSLPSWISIALQHALAYLSPAEKPIARAQEVVRRVNSPVRRLALDLNLKGFAISPYWSREHAPDLPTEDLFEAPAIIWSPQHENDEHDDGLAIGSLDSLYLEQWQAQIEYELHSSGALLPGSDRVLLPSESRLIGMELISIVSDAAMTKPLRITALSYCISMLTSWSHRRSFALLIKLSRTPRDNWSGLNLSPQGFRVVIPAAKKFSKLKELHKKFLHPCVTQFVLPWPGVIKEAMVALVQASELRTPRGKEFWSFHFDEIRDRLRQKAQKISDERIRNVLPSAIWSQRGDIVLTQIITGQLLNHTSASLHYYAYPQRDICTAYTNALSQFFPEPLRVDNECAPADIVVSFIGAPTAPIRDECIHPAVEAVVRQGNRFSARLTLDERIKAYNNLVVQTALMFAAVTAHRLTFHFGLITVSNLLLDIEHGENHSGSVDREDGAEAGHYGVAVFADKLTEGGAQFRLAVLPASMVRQLKVMLRAARYLIANMPRDRAGKSVSERLQEVLDGRRSLFIIFDRESNGSGKVAYATHRLNRRRLLQSWPEFPLPLESLRKRFANRAREEGICPNDIRRQMGHSMDYVPFGATDFDSPLSFADRIATSLERLLVGDHWSVSTFSAGSSVTLSPDGNDTVSALQAAFERHQHRSAIKKSKWRMQLEACVRSNSTNLEAAFDAFVLHDWPEAESDQSEHSSDALQHLGRELGRTCSDPSLLPAVSLNLRKLSAIRRRDGKLKPGRPSRAAFFARSESSTQIQGVIRAYGLCLRLLAWSEVQPLRRPADLPFDDKGFAALIIQFAIRGGLCGADRLIAGIRALPGAKSFGERKDCVVIELDRELGSRPVDEASNTDGELKQGVREGFVLSGLPALIALEISRVGLSFDDVDRDRLEQACRNSIPKDLVGEVRGQVLEALLSVAIGGRRITQAGVRVAWEAGELNCGSLSVEREAAIRRNEWAPPLKSEIIDPESESPVRAVSTFREVRGNNDALYLRALRKLVGGRGSRRFSSANQGVNTPKPRSRRRHLSIPRPQLIKEIGKLYASHKGMTGTSQVITSMVLRLLGADTRSGIRPVSVYTYLVSIMEPIIRILDGRDLLTLDGDELDEVLTATIFTKRPGNRDTAVKAVHHLARQIVISAGISLPEDSVVYSEWIHAASPGYLLTKLEIDYAQRHIDHWRNSVSQTITPDADQRGEREFEQASLRLACSLRMGLRAKEIDLLDATSSFMGDAGTILQIKPRYGQRLKGNAARRSLIIEEFIPGQADVLRLQTFLASRGVVWSSTDKNRVHTNELRLLDAGIQQEANNILILALRIAVPGDSARPHAGRHCLANAVFAGIATGSSGIELSPYQGLEMSVCQSFHEHLDPGLRLIALSRVMGHASPLTTLENYIHLISFMINTDRGWPTPSLRAIANFIFEPSYGALRTRLSRAGIRGRRDTPLAQIIAILGLAQKDATFCNSTDAFKNVDYPGNVESRNIISLSWVGSTLSDLVRGVSDELLAIRRRCRLETLQQLRHELLVLQQQYRFSLIMIDGDGRTQRMGRIPRRSSLGYLSLADRYRDKHPEDWQKLVLAIERQTLLDGKLYIRNSQSAKNVRKIIEDMLMIPCEIVMDDAKNSYLIQSKRRMDRQAGKSEGGISRAPLRYFCIVAILTSRLESL